MEQPGKWILLILDKYLLHKNRENDFQVATVTLFHKDFTLGLKLMMTIFQNILNLNIFIYELFCG